MLKSTKFTFFYMRWCMSCFDTCYVVLPLGDKLLIEISCLILFVFSTLQSPTEFPTYFPTHVSYISLFDTFGFNSMASYLLLTPLMT